MQQTNNFIVIAAAGLGKRMKMSGPKAAIKICDNEITKKILEKKTREYSKNKIKNIKDMLKMKKKTESSFNLLSTSNIISGFQSNNEIMNIIKDEYIFLKNEILELIECAPRLHIADGKNKIKYNHKAIQLYEIFQII